MFYVVDISTRSRVKFLRMYRCISLAVPKVEVYCYFSGVPVNRMVDSSASGKSKKNRTLLREFPN